MTTPPAALKVVATTRGSPCVVSLSSGVTESYKKEKNDQHRTAKKAHATKRKGTPQTEPKHSRKDQQETPKIRAGT